MPTNDIGNIQFFGGKMCMICTYHEIHTQRIEDNWVIHTPDFLIGLGIRFNYKHIPIANDTK